MRSGDDSFQACHAHALYTNPAFLRPDPTASDIRYIPESEGFAWDEDGSVSITALCPQAAQVVMRVGNADTPMRRQADGQWHASLSGVLPGIHACSFLADGIPYINPLMPVGYMGFGISNYFDLPESRSDDCLMHDIPHGSVRLEHYASAVAARTQTCLVYTPPSYEQEQARYPVLYLQHGGGENEQAWLWYGKINYICDSLIARGVIPPLLVVMNCGYVFTGAADEAPSYGSVGDMLARDCIPFIDAHFRTVPSRHARAVAGSSMGAFQANAFGMKHHALAAHIGLLSGELSECGYGYRMSHAFADPQAFRECFDTLLVAYGRDEQPACDRWKQACSQYRQAGVDVLFQEYPGGHEWRVWRRAVADFLRICFGSRGPLEVG